MPQVLNIYDGGIQKIGAHIVGVVIFDIVMGEGKPEKLIGYCRPYHRDSVIKNLKRLVWTDTDVSQSVTTPPPISRRSQIGEALV